MDSDPQYIWVARYIMKTTSILLPMSRDKIRREAARLSLATEQAGQDPRVAQGK